MLVAVPRCFDYGRPLTASAAVGQSREGDLAASCRWIAIAKRAKHRASKNTIDGDFGIQGAWADLAAGP